MRTTEERKPDAVARNRDVSIRGVLLFAFWLAVGAIVVQVAMWGLLRVLRREDRLRDRPLPPLVAVSLARTPPEPRLEPQPLASRARLNAEENAILTTYGWVDRNRGVVRVPIDRAMDLLAARGLPPSKPMPAAAPMPTPVPGGQSR